MVEKFQNDILDISGLPKMETVPLVGLENDYLKIMYANFCINSLITLGIISIPIYFLYENNQWILTLYIVYLLLIVFNLIFIKRKFKYRKYAIREHDVIYQSGWFQLTTSVIPFNKIQNVSIEESWLARKYQLAKLNLYTTGDSLSIEGLSKETAKSIQALILNKIGLKDMMEKDTIYNIDTREGKNTLNNFHEDAG